MVCCFQRAKLRIFERKAKYIWAFLSASNFGEAKVYKKREKCKEKRDFLCTSE